jgi:hypothetical protein
MSYIVTAPLVLAKKEDGSDLYLYANSVIPAYVSDSEIKRLSNLGLIAEVETADVAAAADDVEPKPRGRAKPTAESN